MTTPERHALTAWLTDWVTARLAKDGERAEADVDRPLTELGLASRDAVALAAELSAHVGRPVEPTILWRVPTIRALASELTTTATPATSTTRSSARPDGDHDAPLAVVGVGCRLPGGVDGPEAFWDLLVGGRDAVGTVPEGRWDAFTPASGPERDVLDRLPRTGGFLDDVAAFDAGHFGIGEAEARLMDPQQRLLLEVAWEALEHAGIAPDGLGGTATGVFVGASLSEYAHLTTRRLDRLDVWTPTGSALSILANRLSYLLDLDGPSMTVDTACSSSLVAFHQACRSLAAGECDTAVVGGVNVLLSPTVTASFSLAGLLAADGRCKPFSADADGIVRAEGCTAVVVKRLADAERDGDRVLAVVRGSAVGSDGRSNGLMAPDPAAQERVLVTAYARAGVDPATVDVVEAHGTGTALGDPIEAHALGAVLGDGRPDENPLLIGSVKSNLGHLEAAAGLTGLVKTVLALHHDRVPASLHAERTTEHVDLASLGLRVAQETTPWPRHDGVAQAGVSAFGFGGTNAHVVLEEAPPVPGPTPTTEQDERAVCVLPVSAPDADRVGDRLAEVRAVAPVGADERRALAAALERRLGTGPARGALVVRDGDPAERGLVVEARRSHPGERPVWVFSGYGSHWPAMAARLLNDEPVFAAALETVTSLVHERSGLDVLTAIEGGTELDGVHDQQLATFCVQVALAALWRAQGVEPAAVIGQSMGEVAAAVAAGGLSLRDGVRVMVARTALLADIDQTGAGAMAVVDAGAEEVTAHLAGHADVEVAVHASPQQCTIAGPATAVAEVTALLKEAGREVWPVPGGVAGHTAAVDPVVPGLLAALDGLRARRVRLTVYATSDDDPRATVRHDAEHWARNVRRPVRFAEAVDAALADGHRVFVEVAPHPIAARSLQSCLAARSVDGVVVGSLRRHVDDTVAFHAALTTLRLCTDLPAPAAPTTHTWVDAPRTSWRHERFWFATDAVPVAPALAGTHPVLGAHVVLPEGGRHLWRRRLGDPTDVSGLLLDLVVAAARAALGDTATVVGHLEHEPLPAHEDTELLVSATTDGRVSVHARHAGPDWATCASAIAAPTGAKVVDAPRSGAGSTPPPDAPTTPSLHDELRSLPGPVARERLLDWLTSELSTVLGVGRVDVDAPLVSLGLDSLAATRARNVVQTQLGVPLEVAMVLRGASVRDVATHLGRTIGLDAERAPDRPGEPTSTDTDRAPAQSRPRPTVLARDPSERLVSEAWQQVLGCEEIAVNLHFDELGGDREAMAAVRAVLSERLDDAPTVEQLIAHPTIASMADLVRGTYEDNGGRLVRPLRTSGSRPPLFVFHPAGGPTSVYRPLVQLLDPDQPVIGLERLDHLESVEEKADEYVRHIREIAPTGPYRLLGWSFGGLLADAVAARLERTDTVELVAMIDTVLPEQRPDGASTDGAGADDLLARYRRFAEHIESTYDVSLAIDVAGLAGLDERDQLATLQASLGELGVAMPAGVLQHQLTSYVDTRIAERYRPANLSSPRVLYRATLDDDVAVHLDPRYRRRSADLGWAPYGESLEVVSVPGDHVSMIDRPHVDVIATHLDRLLGSVPTH